MRRELKVFISPYCIDIFKGVSAVVPMRRELKVNRTGGLIKELSKFQQLSR